MLDAPRHLTLFSRDAISRLAELAGFQIERIETTLCYAREVFVISRRLAAQPLRKPGLRLSSKDSILGASYQVRNRIRQYTDGEELLLIARKSR